MSKQIKVSEETKTLLDKLKHLGQTYEGIIRELIRERLARVKGEEEG